VSTPQKVIIALLSTIALIILTALIGVVAFLLIRRPIAAPPVAVAQEAPPTPTSPPTATLIPTLPLATPTPTQPTGPTPTSTRVVTATVQPTASPTPANCINNIINFEASGLLTDEQVELYLRQMIPAVHLDHCRIIEYQHRTVSAHATPVAGSFTPMFRQIYVYQSSSGFQTPGDVLDTLTHEIGHNVHYNLRRDNWDMARLWTELYEESKGMYAREGRGFVSAYAQFNDFEDFAETYRAYIREPELLQYYNPNKYEFMRAVVFGGQEYLP
jgi:hypothetical protein